LFEGGNVWQRSGGSGGNVALPRMEFGEVFRTDLDMRTGRGNRCLQLDDIGQFGKKLGCELRGNRVDERLPGMIGADGIDHDALAGMESVGAFRSEGLLFFDAKSGFWSGGGDFESWKIFDRSGPGELRVVKRCIVTNDGVQQRKRGDEKDDVP
jgi:hypothetical protein